MTPAMEQVLGILVLVVVATAIAAGNVALLAALEVLW